MGQYRVLNVLGSGRTSVVLEALHVDMGRRVALKLIRSDGTTASARARDGLLREAQVLARLRHPNVVTVYDVASHADDLFIAMELVPGPTLGTWLSASRRSWRAILDVFVAAGRGLAAAHDVGIVHRDFQPSHVIVGRDRVVVTDFVVPAPAGRGRNALGALTDQLAFASSLWAALFGSPPMPPLRRGVPDRIVAGLRRALSPRPEDRWPFLGDLVAELSYDMGARHARRRTLAIGCCLGGTALIVAAAAFRLGQVVAAERPCAMTEANLASVWAAPVESQTHDAFRRTGRPYAEEAFARIDTSLQRWLDEWKAIDRDVCEAALLPRTEPEKVIAARRTCLDDARTDVTQLVSLLSHADAATVDGAAAAADRLGDIGACRHLSAMSDASAAPADPGQALETEHLNDDLARVEGLRSLGKLDDGRLVVTATIHRARELHRASILARALDEGGWLELAAGHDEDAIRLGYQTIRAAADARDDARIASGMTCVAYALGVHQHRFDAADVAYHTGLAAAARAGNPGALLERLYSARGEILNEEGNDLGALPFFQIVLALRLNRHGPGSYAVARSLSELADATRRSGHPREADPMFRHALDRAEDALGPEHPLVLEILNQAGVNRLEMFDFDGAAPFFQRAMTSAERLGGPKAPSLAALAHNLGVARRGQHRLDEARALLDRALRDRIIDRGPDDPSLATSYLELARVERLQGHLDEALASIDKTVAWTADCHREKATILIGLGRLTEARTALELAVDPGGNFPGERARALEASADLLRATHEPRRALPLYREAVGMLEDELGRNAPAIVDTLIGLGETELAVGDATAALATAERVGAITTYASAPVDRMEAAHFLIARARWAKGEDRAGSIQLARAARARLATLPYPTDVLPAIDRWLAQR